jgi:hypothetical protein
VITNWTEIAKRTGSLQEDGSESGGDSYGQVALEEVLGEEWIQTTVEHIVSDKQGSEVALACLRVIHSKKAVFYAYEVYKSSAEERAARAVWLIKHLAHPLAFDWVEEFLNDENVKGWGLGVLDQLLWTEQIPYDEKAEALLELALIKSNGQLSDQIVFIKDYINKRKW